MSTTAAVVLPGMTDVTYDQVTMFGADWCRDCRRSKALLDRLGVDYTYVDVEADLSAAARAEEISGRKSIPVVVLPNGTHFVEPSDAELQAELEASNLV
jgi:mycoredoxin